MNNPTSLRDALAAIHQAKARAKRALVDATKSAPRPGKDALAAKAIEKFGGREKFDTMVAAAAHKANRKAHSIDRASMPTAQPAPLTCRDQGAQALAAIKGEPNSPLSKAVKAALNNDRTSRVDANSVRDFPGRPRGGDVLPPYNSPARTTTPSSGGAIRDDGPAARTVADTAATNRRLVIDADVAEATGGLRSQKTRPPTRDEIEQVAQKNARGAESIVGVLRAQRLIDEGKL